MARYLKYSKVAFHIIVIIFLGCYIKQKSIKPIITNKLIRFYPEMKYFLIWTEVPGIKNEGQKHFIEKGCQYLNCYFTKNRSFLGDIRYFDAVVFNLQDISEGNNGLPEVRSLTQKYIFAANDSADNYPVCSNKYEDFFNWTWTYRLDSTIQYRFFSFANIHDDHDSKYQQYWKQYQKPLSLSSKGLFSSKSRAAAILLDKCKSISRRELFVEELRFYLAYFNLTVDVFGRCGTKKFGRSVNSFRYKLKRTYYFYLALEDSISADYVTNIVLYAYRNNVVPVVFGGANYSRFLPHHSYLNGLQLGTKQLAQKMHEIIHHKDSYYDYFRWMNHYFIRESKVLDPCTLCQAMSNPDWLQYRVSYVKFRKWWNPQYEQRCGYNRKFLML